MSKLSEVISGINIASDYMRKDVYDTDDDGKVDSDAVSGQALFHVRDEKSEGTESGDFNSDAWRTRDLNTVAINEIDGASLSSNQITLPNGDYFVQARAPVYDVGRHKARLYDVTNSTTLLWGSSSYSNGYANEDSLVTGTISLSEPVDIELQHICDYSKNKQGFGVRVGDNVSFGGPEVYAEVLIWER